MYKLLAAAAVAVSWATPVNSTLGISPSTQDFVTEAAYSDMLEIESGKLVASKFDTKDTGFAEQMIKDHTASSVELEGLVSNGKVKANLPAAMDKAHGARLDKLKGLDGMAFIKAYEDMQVSAHEEAVSLFERYAKSGDNADLKAFAAKTLPRLQDHLKMAHDLEKLARPSCVLHRPDSRKDNPWQRQALNTANASERRMRECLFDFDHNIESLGNRRGSFFRCSSELTDLCWQRSLALAELGANRRR